MQNESHTAEEISELRNQVKIVRLINLVTVIGLAITNVIFLERYLQLSSYYQQIYEENQQILLNLRELLPMLQKLLEVLS